MNELKLRTIKYKGFKIIPVTEKVKETYCCYQCTSIYIIVNPDDAYEFDVDNIEEAKQWIDCY